MNISKIAILATTILVFLACVKKSPSGDAVSMALANEEKKASAPHTYYKKNGIADSSAMLEELFLNLPDSEMPKLLKQKNKRRKTLYSNNCFKTSRGISYNKFSEKLNEEWNMCWFTKNDYENLLVVVVYNTGVDFYQNKYVHALNYNLKNRTFSTDELKYDAIDLEELINTKSFTPEQVKKFRKLLNRPDAIEISTANDTLTFRLNEGLVLEIIDYDYDAMEKCKSAVREWNGNCFKKVK